MKKESKILIGALVVLLVTLPLIVGVVATENTQGPTGEKLRQFFALRLQQLKSIVLWFFKGAEKNAIDGTVTARAGNILIVTDSDGSRFNIVLPRRWNVGQQVISLDDIDQYVSGYVTVKVLQRTATNEKGVTFTALIAYEITANGKTLYAVLPFNIEG